MKKITLSLFAFLLLIGFGNSQVQIGSGTLEIENAPFEPYFGYSYTQSVYLSSEINASGTITGLQWYYSGTSALTNSQNLVIYLAESTRTSYASTTDWEPITSFTQVYAGGITVNAGTPGWVQIVFDTPFVYSGTDNLLIAVEENMAGYDTSGDDFLNSDVGTDMTISHYSDTVNADPATPPTASNIDNTRPNVIFDGIVQLCPNPSSILVSGIGTDTATIEWTENGSATTWNIEVVLTGNLPTGTPTDVATTNPFTVTGLNADTDYDVYVQSDCGSGELSAWIGPVSFFTGYCSSIPTSNDGQGVTNVQLASTDIPSLGDLTYEDHTATVVDVSQGVTTNLQVSFATGYTYDTNVWIDFNDDLIFEASELLYSGTSLATNPTTLDASFLMPLTANLGQHRMRIGTADTGQATPNPCYGGSYGVTLDFTVNVNPAPSCIPPSGLSVALILSSSAEVSWTDSNGASAWNIEYGPSGFSPGTGTVVGATTNPYNITGLNPETDYDFYVQADCGGGDLSEWTGPGAFTTLCAVYTAPFIESFDTVGSIPNCWAQGASNGESWLFTMPGASHIGNAGDFGGTTSTSGGGFAWVDDSTPDNLGTTLVSPLVDVSTLTSPTLSFFTISNNEGNSNVSFSVDFFDGAAWNIGVYTSNSNTNNWEEIFIDLSGFTITGPVQARFIVDEDNPSGQFYDDRAIDDVSFDEAPSCFDPINVSVDMVSDTTATISWTDGTGAVSTNIEVVTAGTTPTGVATDVTSTNPYTITGLNPATDYEFYIQADCGANGTSAWVGPFAFTTECAVFTAPYTQPFDTVGTIPNCWSQGASNGENWLFTMPGASHIGNAGDFGGTVTASNGGFAWVDDSTPDNLGTTLITPLVDVSTLTTPALSFYTISDNEGNSNVSFSVDFFDGAAWNIGVYTSNSNTAGWEQVFVDLSTFTITGPVQARFIVDENNPAGQFYDDRAIDDVTFDEAPSCFNPINITFSNITDTTVDISWTDGNGATSWNIEIVPTGSTPTGTPTVVTTNPYAVTGLSPAVEYQFYIQTDCGAGGLSEWVGPYTFTMACGIVIPPYLQTYATIPPNCWGVADDGDPTTGPQAIGTSAWVTDGFANIGTTGAYKINLWLAAKSDWLLSPEFDLTGGPFQVELDLAIMQFGSSVNAGTLGSDDEVQLLITSDGGTTWAPLLTWDNTSAVPAGGEHYVYNLTPYSGMIVQFGIWASEGTVDDTSDNDVSVDNFEVRAIPSCPEPTAVTANNFPPDGAEVSWTENGTATSWNIEYGPAGYIPGTGTLVSGVTSNPYNGITGLMMDTSYDFYVQADCGGGDLSEWTGPETLFVGYCQSVPTSNDGQGVTNVQLASTDFPSLGDLTYEDHTATVVDLYQAITTNLQISFATGFTYDTNVWIDFNDNLVFEASELVYSGTSLATNPTTLDASFLMPLTANLGIHRMRIGTADFGQVPPNPCFSGSFGVTLDFTVNINPAPDCIPPSGLNAVSISYTSAEFYWTENNTPPVTSWNVEYGPDGFTPGTGTLVTGVTSIPYVPTDLMVDTDYDFYVQADCNANGDGMSLWAGPASFFHGYCPSIPTSNDGQGVTNVQLNNVNFASLGDLVYEDHTGTTVNLFQGLNIPLFVTFATGFTYDTNVWIDFNDNLVFEDSEIVFMGTSTNANPTTLDCSFLLDIAAQLGIHRMRIGTSDFGQVPPDPCYSGAFGVTLDFTVNIVQLTCTLFEANYTIIDDCANGDQFLIEVDVTDLGSASSLTIANNIDATTWAVPSTGVYTVGPFPFQQNVQLTVSNDQDSNCTLLSPNYYLLGCPPPNDACVNATVATVNTDGSCAIVNPGTILGATPSAEPVGTCTGVPNDDVWFQFVANNDSQLISLSNFAGADPTTTDLDFAVYDGTCGAFTELACSDDEFENVGGLTIGNTYYIRVFSANNASYTTTFDLCISVAPGLVIADQTTYTVDQLVTDVLINSPCATVSNITYSTGVTFDPSEPNGIAYFYRESDGFPFADGVVLASGDAMDITGPNGNPFDSGNWPGDADLFNYIQSTGIDPGLNSYNDATVLEFDFVPYNQHISFEFIFASAEYGTFQCSFSDAFAFFLTETATGTVTNLAVVPGTNDPISVLTIRDDAYNAGCPSVNEQYFADYYGGGGAAAQFAPINFNGLTVPMVAESDVTPYANYHIKLVVADRNDHILNSAVFLKAGSFDLGEIDLGGDFLIADGNASCDGTPITLDTGAPTYPTTWYQDGFEIPGETSSTLVVTEAATYAAQIVFSPTCFIFDEIIVEYLPLPEIAATPTNLESCEDDITGFGTYDLTANDATILGANQNPTDFTITVHATEQDAIDDVNPLASPYTGAPQTVYIRIINNTTACFTVTSFDLVFSPDPTIVQPADLPSCDSDLDGNGDFDLASQTSAILNGQTGMTVTYHASLANAESGTGALPTPYTSTPSTIYVRVVNDATGCYSVTMFNTYLLPNPANFTEPSDMQSCADDDGYGVFDLESQTATIANGNANYVITYYSSSADAMSGTNALSSPYSAMPPQTVYVRVEDSATGCYSITSFVADAYPYEDPSFDYEVSLIPCYDSPGAVIYGDTGGTFSIEGGVNVTIDAQTGVITGGASGESYVVTYTTAGPCPQSSSMTVQFETCIIPQAISPNGDGMNDSFDLSAFDVQKLEIFNRYGVLVYTKTNYTDQWHGQSDSGDELPVGTYYYVMRYQNGKEKASWVYINK